MQFEIPPFLDGLFLVVPRRHGDFRGYFVETFREDLFSAAAGPVHFVQDNQSMSAEVGTVWGSHFQLNPRAQGKPAVASRRRNPGCGRRHPAGLADPPACEGGTPPPTTRPAALQVPPGFAHGFCTLEPNTVIAYKVTDYWRLEHDRGLRWSDPAPLTGRSPETLLPRLAIGCSRFQN